MIRRFRVPLAFLAIVVAGCAASYRALDADEAVTPAEMRRHVDYLASDALRGRNTPSPELDTAAAYIAGEFAAAGLRPLGTSWYQQVRLGTVALSEPNALLITRQGDSVSFAIKDDFTPFDVTGPGSAEGEVVFCGYGITAPEYQYDDYAGFDVRGKVVLVLRHEPGENDSASVFKGKRPTDYGNVGRKMRIARDHGAAAVLVVTDPLNHQSMTPRGFPWPSLSKIIPHDALPLRLDPQSDEGIPVVHVGERVVAALLGSVDSLRALQRSIDSTCRPSSFRIPARARVVVTTIQTLFSARNVIGVLEGSDPLLKSEYIVVGAHYDHVGAGKAKSPGVDVIFNGADDNASGTAALLGVARAFGSAAYRPARSILLMAFAGEEKGLFGSAYFVRHPSVPLDHVAGMVNLDMVGRNAVDSLFILGGEAAPVLERLAIEEGPHAHLAVIPQLHADGGSDHESFAGKNIPSVHFFSGLHPDYHQVSDHADKINSTKVARVARLAFRVAWRAAAAPDSVLRPLFQDSTQTRSTP
jgi:hypothetical protein